MGLPREYQSPSRKKQRSKRKIKIGDRYLVQTFASVKVHTEITKIDNEETGIYMGKLLRKEDLDNLREAGVPYKNNEDPESCVSVVYDFQIIKKIKTLKKSKSSDKNPKGKRRYVRKNSTN